MGMYQARKFWATTLLLFCGERASVTRTGCWASAVQIVNHVLLLR